MINVQNVTKRYGQKYAADDVSFQVQKGEIVGFLGRNGAGKTTTMNIITGYISSTAGTVEVDGYDILKDPYEVKKRIGYLPEQPPLYMDMTVSEYLKFACDLKSVPKTKQDKHIGEICDVVKIADMRKRLIKNLSKGYKQRVGLAQALVGNPEILIFDEPTVGLDPKQIIEIRRLIKMLGRSHTVVLSSHILPEVSEVCERVVIIHQGKIVAQDTLVNLTRGIGENIRLTVRVAGSSENAIRKTLGELYGANYVETIGSMEPDSFDFRIETSKEVDIRKPLFNALAKISCPILMLKPVDITLEDIFLQLTTAVGEEGL